MPLNGSDVASKPAGTTAVANTTIESTPFNSVIDDIYSILNTVRTVAKGYTGASTEAGAIKSLKIGRYQPKASGYTAALADLGTIFRITAASTLALTAAATLGTGWWCMVLADGGAVTVDPDSSETINGSATLTVADGDWAIITTDGTAFYALANSDLTVLDEDDMASDSATLPPSQQSVKAYAQPLAALLTDISGLTVAEGDILYVNSSGDIVNLGAGSDGEILTLASGVPSWAAATGGIGDGQTWQDVSGSRAISTSYQNTTGKPIMVNVVDPTDGANGNLQVSTDNSTWVTVSNTVDFGQASAIVPDTHYYRLTGGNISVWSELR